MFWVCVWGWSEFLERKLEGILRFMGYLNRLEKEFLVFSVWEMYIPIFVFGDEFVGLWEEN